MLRTVTVRWIFEDNFSLSVPCRHIKNGLTIYQQPVQQELALLMNEAAFAGNNQKRAQEKEETRESWTKEQSAILICGKTYFKKFKLLNSQTLDWKWNKKLIKRGNQNQLRKSRVNFVIWKTGTKKQKIITAKLELHLYIYPPFHNDFEEMLTSRDVINLKYVKEVGTGLSPAKTDDAEKSLKPGSPVLDLGKWNRFLPGKVCCPHWAFKCTIALDCCYTYHLDAESMKTPSQR